MLGMEDGLAPRNARSRTPAGRLPQAGLLSLLSLTRCRSVDRPADVVTDDERPRVTSGQRNACEPGRIPLQGCGAESRAHLSGRPFQIAVSLRVLRSRGTSDRPLGAQGALRRRAASSGAAGSAPPSSSKADSSALPTSSGWRPLRRKRPADRSERLEQTLSSSESSRLGGRGSTSWLTDQFCYLVRTGPVLSDFSDSFYPLSSVVWFPGERDLEGSSRSRWAVEPDSSHVGFLSRRVFLPAALRLPQAGDRSSIPASPPPLRGMKDRRVVVVSCLVITRPFRF